jgi:hypothetical protein
MTSTIIDQNEFYLIKDEMLFHCDESQFVHVCKACGEQMGCYYCEFDYSQPCDCQYDMVGSVLFTTKEGN